MKRKNKGITLIALVITIIVLLILAGVALSLVAGNEGILEKAETAASETNEASAKEQAELLIAEITADYYEARYVKKTESGGVVDYIKTQLASGKETSNDEYSVTVDENGNVTVADYAGNEVMAGSLTETGKVTWNEGSGLEVIPEGLEVGDTVTYSPSGTYNWVAEYASSDLANDGTADVALATGTAVTEATQDMSITSWKVLSIDEITGKVELLPSAPSTGTVRLQGPQGYNNAVKLLNDACSNLYGNGSTITARSINMDDIEGWMTETALAEAHSYENTSNSLKWGEQTESAYSTTYSQYPTIYAKENLSVINGKENTTGLGMSEQTALIGRTDEGATNGKIATATSIQPYQTYWKTDKSFMQTAFKGDGYNLLIPSGTSTKYWVASRCVTANWSDSHFLVREIYNGSVSSSSVGSSYSYVSYDAHALFPVVTLSANLLEENGTDGWKVK